MNTLTRSIPRWSLLLSLLLVAPGFVSAQGGGAGKGKEQPAKIKLANELMREGKTAEAITAVQKQLQEDPTSGAAANLLDVLGATSEARKVFQKRIDTAADPTAKAAAQRAMAMSYAFDGDTANVVKLEQQVIAYWVTREAAEPQERFFPYLVGYVALYTGDLKTAEAELSKTVAMTGNQNDPFMTCLLAMTHEKLGQADKAKELYRKAYGMATAHNPPAAFARPFARKKLGL